MKEPEVEVLSDLMVTMRDARDIHRV